MHATWKRLYLANFILQIIAAGCFVIATHICTVVPTGPDLSDYLFYNNIAGYSEAGFILFWALCFLAALLVKPFRIRNPLLAFFVGPAFFTAIFVAGGMLHLY